ncbi:hypothetical protein [Vagococcus intermedius]|uniref:Uncharacterized protein n=1 Tax=Vagococcus intermedius TaxID=2991418 RepID=A0AAF0I993_9ENTE|nr:hypothetical protein [Vagococcus intermedius]WEG73232.1 hypothetical protein OL234_09765 [Vagococcus intermedius]WEG75317.1 hypothetical protein OL235_09760 [Vagococcus intermedius]
MKANLGFYIQKINDVVTETEQVGESMNPYFVEVRTALDANDAENLTKEKLAEVQVNFKEGTAKYETMLKTIRSLKAPAKVMGIHKKLEKGYDAYVSACNDMVQAIDVETGVVDQELFDASEVKQDETTNTIAFCIQRMTSLLMK